MSYEYLDHTADVKFRAVGSTVSEMYISAADALLDTMRGDIKILEQKEISIEVEGKDHEILLHNFLEEFLFLLDAKDFLVAKIKDLSISENKIKFVVVGDSADNYKFTNDVKAITFNEMKIGEDGGKYYAEVILDV
ncbi:MAG: archease [Nanoarchaeota archaeon]|nr:archease [Nanoarchaeota archaeon]